MVPVSEFTDDAIPALLHAQRHGEEDGALASIRIRARTGIKAIKVEDGDELIDVQITSGTNES